MLIEGCYNLIEKCLYSTSKCVTVGVWFGSKKVLPEVAKIFSQINISVVFYTCIQNQVIHKHVNIQLMTFDEVNTRIDQPI
jgi:tRNA(Ile2) C34 agmatinyltransferase TiaS